MIEWTKILKANPYHDEKGRFSSQDKTKFVSIGGIFASQNRSKPSKTEPEFSAEFASMPSGKSTSPEAKKWLKGVQAKYDTDPNFRSLVDGIGYITQGDFILYKEHSAKESGGDFSEEAKGSLIPKLRDRPITPNPMAKYKNFLKGQDLNQMTPESGDRKTYGQVARMLNATIDKADPITTPIFRGLTGRQAIRQLEGLKEGDVFDVPGVSSFTLDRQIALDFSEGNAKGQSKAKRGPGHGVLIEVEPGAKVLPVSALSPWDQREVL